MKKKATQNVRSEEDFVAPAVAESRKRILLSATVNSYCLLAIVVSLEDELLFIYSWKKTTSNQNVKVLVNSMRLSATI